ncbi:hypothetical protein [Hyalangium sp.]|uniref:hypothetical protein n=1 Tax=Hyalangium sp. TaxID=2028555 RepID=UPI002D50BDEB|nr:hypothetical protein [Hyalangium sp.]HYI02861.1 hypothetical protein [Hyalangium sp.]
MSLRNTLGAAVLIATAIIGCSGRDEPVPDGGPDGCTGACNQNDGGTKPDGGVRVCPAADSQGRGPIGILRAMGTRGQAVRLEHLVVTVVDSITRGSQGDYIAYFWAVDPCFPKEGIYVDKFYTDATTNYRPEVGDEVTIDGLYRQYNSIASDADETRHAYRPVLKSDFRLGVPGVTGRLIITKTGTGTVPQDITVPATFGDANGGEAKANADHGGARIHIPGPVSITNANPPALKQRPDSPENGVHLGFEVTGGVLVNNYKTFGETRDGGSTRCDWRNVVNDGGTVSFPNGIRGVWDTYSFVPCADGGFTSADGGTFSSCNFALRDAGVVPGTSNDSTYVLYPQDCATDLPGVVGTP